MFAKEDILSNEHFPPVIAFSFITLSQNEQRKITVALSQDGGGGLGKSAGRYYSLGRELLPGVAGRAARWQRRAAKEAAQSRPWPGERETTIVNIEQLRAAASGSAGSGAEADQPSPTLE